MLNQRFFLSDFVGIQRQSFFELLEKGLIEEFEKRNPIINDKQKLVLFFYPEYYILTRPEYNKNEAILKNKSYTSQLFVPVQIIQKQQKKMVLKWVYIGNIPLMTTRGHFILNGAARVIVNQILRSPGVYYQETKHDNLDIQTQEILNINKKGDFNAEKDKNTPMSNTSNLRQTIDYKTLSNWQVEAFENQRFSKHNSQKIIETPSVDKTSKRYYADFICMRGTWLRIEMDKQKTIWAQIKKTPKIPIYWFLLAMGLSEKTILKAITDPERILCNLEPYKKLSSMSFRSVEGISKPEEFGRKHQNKNILPSRIALVNGNVTSFNIESKTTPFHLKRSLKSSKNKQNSPIYSRNFDYLKTPPEAWEKIYQLLHLRNQSLNKEGGNNSTKKLSKKQKQSSDLNSDASLNLNATEPQSVKSFSEKMYTLDSKNRVTANKRIYPNLTNTQKSYQLLNRDDNVGKNFRNPTDLGRQWIYNRFMNPKSYDLGKYGRLSFNHKLGLKISPLQRTLTGLDILYAVELLIKLEKGLFKTDDIDHLKNRRVRTSGELIQIQIGIGLIRLEKWIHSTLNAQSILGGVSSFQNDIKQNEFTLFNEQNCFLNNFIEQKYFGKKTWEKAPLKETGDHYLPKTDTFKNKIQNILNTKTQLNQKVIPIVNNKAFNSAIREFFGTSPLSQFMDQINPLSELTHKRRLSSMGPGGVTRDNATLAIRGIHPTHYGRICPIETPEGKNTGLVNSLTTYARVNKEGLIETPFYKVYKGQVQKHIGMQFFNAEQEQKLKLAAGDINVSEIGFLPKSLIPIRFSMDLTILPRFDVEFIGVSPIQMISIAAALIPFLEHDDANRALMGSNMQRQAVPIIKAGRPIVGTGLEPRAVSDSGHVVQTKLSGLITYVSSDKIQVMSF